MKWLTKGIVNLVCLGLVGPFALLVTLFGLSTEVTNTSSSLTSS
jgi:hypothetical protein